MIEAVRQQLAAHGQKIAPVTRKPTAALKSSSGPSAAQQARETAAQVALVQRGPVRWNEAGALFRQQHPGTFRLVVVGHQDDLPAVLQALEQLTQP
jgi:hypothetical protein